MIFWFGKSGIQYTRQSPLGTAPQECQDQETRSCQLFPCNVPSKALADIDLQHNRRDHI